MEHPSKRRRIERNLGGLFEGLRFNMGRERSVSLGGSSKIETPMMHKLVLPPHGAPGHPAHGDQAVEESNQGVDRPHYPREVADTKPSRVHARHVVHGRHVVQPSATDVAPTAHKTTEEMLPQGSSQTSGADDDSYPGQVVPPAAVAAANARNQALESQQAQAKAQAQAQDVPVKQLDAIPQPLAPTPETYTAVSASASPQAMKVLDSSSQQVVIAPSTPLPSSPSPTPESSASYFSTSTASSPSPSPQHSSTPSAPTPTFTPSKHEFATNLNGTMSGTLLY